MSRNDGFRYREQIGADAEGQRVEDYLARRYRHTSLSEWRSRIRSGRILVDSCRVDPRARLRRGQSLVWHRPGWDEPEAPRTFAVLLEDETLLAVEKPAGLPTLPGAGFLHATLWHLVRAYAPGAAPLHRLGRWTSGVVLFAKTRVARGRLARQWAARSVVKRYRGLACGSPGGDTFDVTAPIGPVHHRHLGTVHAVSACGRPATTHVEVVERRDDGFLCDVRIESGRPHQIRIHLAAAGHPLVGDPLYAAGGLPLPRTRAVPGDPGYDLHASELTFDHPDSAREVTVTCAPPSRLRCS